MESVLTLYPLPATKLATPELVSATIPLIDERKALRDVLVSFVKITQIIYLHGINRLTNAKLFFRVVIANAATR